MLELMYKESVIKIFLEDRREYEKRLEDFPETAIGCKAIDIII